MVFLDRIFCQSDPGYTKYENYKRDYRKSLSHGEHILRVDEFVDFKLQSQSRYDTAYERAYTMPYDFPAICIAAQAASKDEQN